MAVMECSGVLKDQLTCDSNLVQKIRSGGVCKVPYGEGCTAPRCHIHTFPSRNSGLTLARLTSP